MSAPRRCDKMPEVWQGGSSCRRVLLVVGAIFPHIKDPIVMYVVNIFSCRNVFLITGATFRTSKIHTVFGPNCLYVLIIIQSACSFFILGKHLVLNNRVPSVQVQCCVFIGARRLVGHLRTNVLDRLLIACLWVPDKISDGPPRSQ